MALVRLQGHRCFHCGVRMLWGYGLRGNAAQASPDRITSVDACHTAGNMVLTCLSCNRARGILPMRICAIRGRLGQRLGLGHTATSMHACRAAGPHRRRGGSSGGPREGALLD